MVIVLRSFLVIFFFKQKTAYEMRISDWSSDVCSSDLPSILTIPYAAITAFVDPSVDFGLQFQVADDGEAPEPHDEAHNDRPEVTSEDGSNVVTADFEIGRASCRDRVCQYV